MDIHLAHRQIYEDAIFPDKDFKFNSQNAADAVNFEKEVTDKKE